MAARQAAPAAREKPLNRPWHGPVSVGALDLFVQVLEDSSNKPNESQDEGAEQQAAHIVSECPPVAPADAEVSTLVDILGEVPRDDGDDKHVLRHSQQEGSHPEEEENGVPQVAFLFIRPHIFVVVNLKDWHILPFDLSTAAQIE